MNNDQESKAGLIQELGDLRKRLKQLEKSEIERKQAEELIKHLNLVLRAIRGVNQLIIREKELDRLLQGVCDILIETRGYHNAWIALLGESGKFITSAEAGLGEDFLPMVERLKRGDLPACAQKALKQSETVVIEDPPSTCTDCPLTEKYSGRGAMTVRLEHGGKVYGLLSVTIPTHFTAHEEEQALFKEVAGDIAFARHSMELEEERKQAEQELRMTRDYLEKLIDHANASIIVWDPSFRIIRFNRAFERLTGYTAEEVITQELRMLFPEASREETMSKIKQTLKGEHWELEEIPILCKDGDIRIVLWNSANIYAEDGTIPLVTIAQGQDITERKRAEEQIKRKSAIVEAINKLFQETLICETVEEVAYTCINMAEELTGSEYGLVGEINQAGRFDTLSYGDLGWAICKMPESDAIALSKNMIIRGIWGQAILKSESQIVNDTTSHPDRVGVPEGHPQIDCFLGVPLKYAGKTIGMIGLANKEGGYTPADQEAVEALSVAFLEALRRKRAEEALKESEVRFRGVFESKMIGTLFWNAEGDITDANDAFLKMVGYTKDDVLSGKARWRDMTPPEYKHLDDKGLQEIIDTGVMTPIEKEYIRKDGSRIPILLGAASLPGPAISGVAFVVDITDKKQAEEKLKEYSEKLEEMVEERTKELNNINIQLKDEIVERMRIQKALTVERERLSVTLRSIGDGMIAADIEGKITLFNKAAEKLTGWTQEEAFGKPLADIFHIINQKTRERCINPVEKVLETGEIVGLANDTILVARDGTERIIADSGAPIHDKDGKVIGVVLVFSDITERKQAEEALRLQSEIVSNMAEGVVLTQASNGEIIYTNSRFDEMFGYNEGELIGMHVTVLNAPGDKSPEETAEEIIKSLNEKGMCLGDVNNIKKDGTLFWCRASVTTLEHSQYGEVWVSVLADITELRRLEEELMLKEKLAVLGQLAGGVGHELRNPLGAIKNAAYFLNMALEQSEPEVMETLEILEKEVETSERIISSLLDFARPKPPALVKVDVNEVVQEALSGIKVPENVEVVTQFESSPIVLADPHQLERVFGNIILNGIQAMSEGGRLVIKSEVPDTEWVSVSIADTGAGIPKENLEKLFEPLYTTKAKGIGLGLALTKTLVEVNGGTIEVESELGKGSAFTVRLPISKKEEK